MACSHLDSPDGFDYLKGDAVTNTQLRRRAAGIGVVALMGALALSACGATKSSTSSSTTALDKIKKAGVINIATDASYAPNEFKQNGKIVGFDVDLGNAIAQKIGVKAQFSDVTFDNILPALTSGKYDISLSSFTDSKKREASFDFVTYFSAGESLIVKTGNPLKLGTSGLSLCGQKIAVEKTTTEESDIKAGGDIYKRCTAAGKKAPEALSFDTEDQANLALSSGRAVGILADSPVALYAVKQSGGKFAVADAGYGASPYGIAIPQKEPELRDAILKAVKDMVADGSFKQISDKWGVSSGDITNPQVNGATS
jgi:polar amino acid transport system substrate-binding protein